MWNGKTSSGLLIDTCELTRELRNMERERKALEYVERKDAARRNSKRMYK